MSYDLYEDDKRLGFLGTTSCVKTLSQTIGEIKSLKALNGLLQTGSTDEPKSIVEDIRRYQAEVGSPKKQSECDRTLDNLLNVALRARHSLKIQ